MPRAPVHSGGISGRHQRAFSKPHLDDAVLLYCRDSDLTARITGLEVRLARRSAEVEMLKAAVLACTADCPSSVNAPSPPVTPQVSPKVPDSTAHLNL